MYLQSEFAFIKKNIDIIQQWSPVKYHWRYRFSNQCSFLDWATNETLLSLNKLLLRLVHCLFISILVCMLFCGNSQCCMLCLWFAATIYGINKTRGVRRPVSTQGDGIRPSLHNKTVWCPHLEVFADQLSSIQLISENMKVCSASQSCGQIM